MLRGCLDLFLIYVHITYRVCYHLVLLTSTFVNLLASHNYISGCNVPFLVGREILNNTDFYSFTLRNRSALEITDTELKVIAAAAIIGLNNNPKAG